MAVYHVGLWATHPLVLRHLLVHRTDSNVSYVTYTLEALLFAGKRCVHLKYANLTADRPQP